MGKMKFGDVKGFSLDPIAQMPVFRPCGLRHTAILPKNQPNGHCEILGEGFVHHPMVCSYLMPF
jgi:hypothetical protein